MFFAEPASMHAMFTVCGTIHDEVVHTSPSAPTTTARPREHRPRRLASRRHVDAGRAVFRLLDGAPGVEDPQQPNLLQPGAVRLRRQDIAAAERHAHAPGKRA